MASTSSKSKKRLRSFPLSRKTPADLRKAITDDDIDAFQKAYIRAIAKPLKRFRKQLDGFPLLALWSENTVELSGRERELAASLDELSDRSSEKRSSKKSKGSKSASPYEEILANWLIESGGMPGPWETIAIAEILLREGHRLSSERFTSTLSILADAVLREPIGGLFEGSESISESDDAIRQIISKGEAPWICSVLLSPLGDIKSIQQAASEALVKVLEESSDADGLVHGSMIRRLSEWLAPLARCTFLSEIFEQPLWQDDSQQRLTAVVERAVMLVLPISEHHADSDSPNQFPPALADVLEFFLAVAGSASERRLQRFLKDCRKPATEVSSPKKFKKKKGDGESSDAKGESSTVTKKNKPPVSWQSDNSCVAILRSGLEADSDVLTLEWHSSDAQVLLAAAGVPILTGHWNWSVKIDDEIVPAPSTWKCSCWFLDPETVFVELEGEDSAPVKRVRQLLLAPHDRFAMMTDSVTCKDPERRIQLVTSVPLAEGTVCTLDAVTRELSLSVGPRRVRTFPLWMEDDRVQHTLGSYREHDGQLELSGVGKGGVTLPLALDWHPKRDDAPADWARLTVTDARRIVGAHEASGFRIRIGNHQVLLYRSLMAGQNSRAVLGLHTWDESVYSRVPSKPGQLEPLVEVESPE